MMISVIGGILLVICTLWWSTLNTSAVSLHCVGVCPAVFLPSLLDIYRLHQTQKGFQGYCWGWQITVVIILCLLLWSHKKGKGVFWIDALAVILLGLAISILALLSLLNQHECSLGATQLWPSNGKLCSWNLKVSILILTGNETLSFQNNLC